MVAAFASWHAENHRQARAVHYELHGLTPAHYRRIAPLCRQATDVLTEIVAGGVRAGDFHVRRHRRGGSKYRDPDKLGDMYATVSERLVR